MTLETVQAAERKLLVQTYERSPHVFVSGHGVYLRDANGEDYLDLLSGIGVSALGYGHPAIEAAIAAQSKRLLHTSNLFYHPGTAPLALQLTEISGLDRVFFCNSGTEAWEAALKLARAHAGARRTQGHEIGTRFLAMEHSFHGRTMGSVATTHKEKYRAPFAPVMPDVSFVRFNDCEDLERKFDSKICAICLETIQGEGGIHPVSPEFLQLARRLTQKTGALLIADEIQCGFGRTGRWFAYQSFGILPDITTVAKPLAGGLPMGAMLCTNEVAAAFTPGMHGTTFGGGPLACAVATAVIDTIRQDRLLDHVTAVGEYFKAQLEVLSRSYPVVKEVRGMGLMLGMELASAEIAQEVASAMLRRHILLNRTSDTVLRFLPPYILEVSHVDMAVRALDECLQESSSLAAMSHVSTAPALGEFHE